ncbi:MAG: uracil phosphoribosyltransferase [Saprospiraceae bacterium]|nr:uracil phosphoribosyltransferase [Saprospiraceae bacterium]
MIHILSEQSSILNSIIGELRCVQQQADPMRFRTNLERVGELMAYEISKTLSYNMKEVETPLGIAEAPILEAEIVLGCILRAGLPYHQGMLRMFDKAGNAFVSAYRKHHKDGTFDIKVEYISCPVLEEKILILADPMIATGSSVVKSIEGMLAYGKPKEIHIAGIIASQEGLEYVRRMLPEAKIWVGALDEELTAKAYIVPGLGDAGDLAFGAKIQE